MTDADAVRAKQAKHIGELLKENAALREDLEREREKVETLRNVIEEMQE